MTRAIDHRCVENIRQGCRIAGPSVAGVASVFQEGSRKGKFLKLQLRKTVVDVNSGYQGVRVYGVPFSFFLREDIPHYMWAAG